MQKDDITQALKNVKEYEHVGSFVMGVLVVIALFALAIIGLTQMKFDAGSLPERIKESVLPTDPTPTAATPNPASDQGAKTHIVQKSEGLWQISQQYYNDGNQYLKIYEANKDKMKSPEDISEGMELVIP